MLCNSASKGRLGSAKTHEIKSTASESFGIKIAIDSFSFQINQLIEQIKFIEKQITELEKQIQVLLEKFDTPIQSLPGVGPVLGAAILILSKETRRSFPRLKKDSSSFDELLSFNVFHVPAYNVVTHH